MTKRCLTIYTLHLNVRVNELLALTLALLFHHQVLFFQYYVLAAQRRFFLPWKRTFQSAIIMWNKETDNNYWGLLCNVINSLISLSIQHSQIIFIFILELVSKGLSWRHIQFLMLYYYGLLPQLPYSILTTRFHKPLGSFAAFIFNWSLVMLIILFENLSILYIYFISVMYMGGLNMYI